MLLLMFSIPAFSQNDTIVRRTKNEQMESKIHAFHLQLKLYTEGNESTNGTIKISKNGKSGQTTKIEGNSNEMEFDLNQNYVIELNKEGYSTKSIYIDTHVPDKRAKNEFALFKLFVHLQKLERNTPPLKVKLKFDEAENDFTIVEE